MYRYERTNCATGIIGKVCAVLQRYFTEIEADSSLAMIAKEKQPSDYR
jgi:hypothetical protein